jgi:hypothetical protein
MSVILSNDCHDHLFFFGEKPDRKRTIMRISRMDRTRKVLMKVFLQQQKELVL